MRRPATLLLLTLASLAATSARATDCARPEVVCVPEESTLEDAFLDVPNGGTIDVAAGTYPSPAADNGFRLGGQPGSAQRDRSFTVRARGAAGSVTLTGESTRRIVVLDRLGAGRWITFEGLRFVDGRSATVNVAAAVTLKDARATFVDCEFVGNRVTAAGNGGAGLGLFGRAQAIVLRSLFDGNRSIRDGAALFAQTGLAPYDAASEVWIWGSTFRNNCETGNLSGCSGGDGVGGAILIRNSVARIADSSFENNRAGWVGGALFAIGSFTGTSPYCNFANPSSDVYVVRSRFVGNTLSGTPTPSGGGAAHIEDCTRAQFRATLFEDNDGEWGGAIQQYRSRVVVTQSVFRNNGTAAPGSEVNELGGSVALLSSDGTGTGPDYPAAQIFVAASLFDGGPAGTIDSQHGGCVAALGESERPITGTCDASETTRCAQLTFVDTAFFDCDVGLLGGVSVPAGGGAISTLRSYVSISGAVFARNDATGANGRGGAIEARDLSRVELTDVVYSGNSAAGTAPDGFASADSELVESNVAHWSATQGGPPDGELLAVPSFRFAATPLVGPESWLSHAWRGSSATLDASPLPGSPHNGLVSAGAGTHTLLVDGSVQRQATVSAAAVPTTGLTAADSCPSGGSTTLTWSTGGGTPIASIVDQGVGGTTPSGSAAVSPAGTVTYRRLAILDTGADVDDATVYIGECPEIFSDGFESGDTSAWSSTSP